MADLDIGFLQATTGGAIRAGTPLLFAAVGELIYERSGVLNLAIEGMMLVGAMTGVAAQLAWGSWPLAFFVALVAGGLFGLLHGVVCTNLRANQIATGLALMTLASGLTAFLGRNLVGQRLVVELPAGIPWLESLPWLGPALFRHDFLVYVAFACASASWFFLYRTRPGVTLRAVGEDAQTAAARGLPVVKIRLIAGAVAGGFCALGGAHLALAYASQWQEGMTAGRGWISLVLVICSLWRPRLLILYAYLFGGLSALQLNLQAAGLAVSSYLLGMMPFLASLGVLVAANLWLRGRPLGMPADLAKPFRPIE